MKIIFIHKGYQPIFKDKNKHASKLTMSAFSLLRAGTEKFPNVPCLCSHGSYTYKPCPGPRSVHTCPISQLWRGCHRMSLTPMLVRTRCSGRTLAAVSGSENIHAHCGEPKTAPRGWPLHCLESSNLTLFGKEVSEGVIRLGTWR